MNRAQNEYELIDKLVDRLAKKSKPNEVEESELADRIATLEQKVSRKPSRSEFEDAIDKLDDLEQKVSELEERLDNQSISQSTGETTVELETETSSEDLDSNSFSCPSCSFETESARTFSIHLSNEHKNPRTLFESEDGYQCPVCGSVYGKANILSSHMCDKHDESFASYINNNPDLFNNDDDGEDGFEGEPAWKGSATDERDRQGKEGSYATDDEADYSFLRSDGEVEREETKAIGDIDPAVRPLVAKRFLNKKSEAMTIREILEEYFKDNPSDPSAQEMLRIALRDDNDIVEHTDTHAHRFEVRNGSGTSYGKVR